MTLDSLQQYLGGDPGQQQDYSDFLQRFQNDPNSISEEEAAQRYRELTRNLPPDLAAEVHAQVLGQLPQGGSATARPAVPGRPQRPK